MMQLLALEPTNRCNRACLHCFRNKADPPESMPLDLAEAILRQARSLGIQTICLTGGEVALYPHLKKLLRLIADYGFRFTLVTNGHGFEKKVLPTLREAKVRDHLVWVTLSLDGGTAETHDALRGRGSFAEVAEAALLCRTHDLPLSLKSAITALNQEELDQLALLGAKLGARQHAFLYLLPTSTLIKEDLLPAPQVLDRIALSIMNELSPSLRNEVMVEGFFPGNLYLDCGLLMNHLYVDSQGRLIFCCNLSHLTGGDGLPSSLGEEVVADLREVLLTEGIRRKFFLLAKFMDERLRELEEAPALERNPCHWCLKYFGKLDWLKDFPDSPWAARVWGQS